MAKLLGNVEEIRRSSFRGSYYVYAKNGQLILAKWPKKRVAQMSPKQSASVDKFTQAARATKYMTGYEQNLARKLTKGTNALPRDMLMMALYGRLGVICLTSGERIYPMGARNDVSEVINAIGMQPGSILFRGDDYWQILEPAIVGQVLTIGEDLFPEWQDAGGGGGGGGSYFTQCPPGGTSSTAYAAKGALVNPVEDFQIAGLFFAAEEVNLATYKAQLWKVNGGLLDTLVAESAEQEAPASATNARYFPFATAANMLQGNEYAVFHVRTDAADNTSSGCRAGSYIAFGAPVMPTSTFARVAKKDPQPGDALSTGSNAYHHGFKVVLA